MTRLRISVHITNKTIKDLNMAVKFLIFLTNNTPTSRLSLTDYHMTHIYIAPCMFCQFNSSKSCRQATDREVSTPVKFGWSVQHVS